MRKFGIEIRQQGDMKSLYSEVDKALQLYQIPAGSVNGNIQAQAVAHSLQKMFNVHQHFCVFTIMNCADIGQVIISKERMDVYHSQHCIKWNEMAHNFRLQITAMVLDDFRHILNPQ